MLQVPEFHGDGVSKKLLCKTTEVTKLTGIVKGGLPCCYTRIIRMHHRVYGAKSLQYKNDCSCPVQSHNLFICQPQ